MTASTALRSVEVTYSDGTVIPTSMASNLTDEQIHEYFNVGKQFNIGSLTDNVQTVAKCLITK